jgi:hypothetical protein
MKTMREPRADLSRLIGTCLAYRVQHDEWPNRAWLAPGALWNIGRVLTTEQFNRVSSRLRLRTTRRGSVVVGRAFEHLSHEHADDVDWGDLTAAEDWLGIKLGLVSSRESWCDCADAPLAANGPLTCLDHLTGCGFPTQACTVDAHRVMTHSECGRPVQMRYCSCGAGSRGFTYDIARGWWVHYVCAWPTRAWFSGAGKPAPPILAGCKPMTYHEFQSVPSKPKADYDRLSLDQKRSNDAAVGGWVWD